MEDSARGRSTPRGSSSSSSNSGVRRMQGGPKQHARSRGFGQLSLDGTPLLTPDPTGSMPSNGNGTAAVTAAGPKDSGSSNGKNGGRACGGCRASGVTALDDNPLLTQAPAMGDAISTINAARGGKQKVITPQQMSGSPGCSSTSSGSSSPKGSYGNGRAPYVSSSSDVVGCGGCGEALDKMAAASSMRAAGTITSAAAAAAAAAAADPQPSGALALDGGALFTEEPGSDRMAAAVAAARQGSRSGSVSVSSSALSSLASVDSSDELELLVKFNKYELQERLQQQLEQYHDKQQQQQQQHALSSGGGTMSSGVSRTGRRSRTSSSSSVYAASSGVLTSSSAAASLAAAAAACAASQQLAVWLSAPALQLLLLSCCALGLSVTGSAVHKMLRKDTAAAPASKSSSSATAAAAVAAGPFSGASQLGQMLMGLFFATLGASCCCSWSSLAAAAPLLGFVGVMVGVHWALLAVLGSGLLPGMRKMRLPVEVLLAGSAANIGGPATAAGLAAARGWGRLVQPSLLCGSLGYALGTAGGLLLARSLGVV
jgi:hypothetical protein